MRSRNREKNQSTNVTQTLGRYCLGWNVFEWFLREDWSEQSFEGMKV